MKRFLFPVLTFLTACSSSTDAPLQNKIVRIADDMEPESLDPRFGRSLYAATSINLLFEGLLAAENGRVVPGIAKSYGISPDGKTYTFHLRDSKWSNGEPLTAYDFEAAWKNMLFPETLAPNAGQLYVLKNAKAAKEGQVPADSIGVKALDSLTLVVELEDPIQFFPKLLTAYYFAPVHLKSNGEVTNGPLRIKNWERQHELVLEKNPHYWDVSSVKIDGAKLIVVPNQITALQMFENGELDWAGSSLSLLPPDSLPSLRARGMLESSPAAGTHWFRFNTSKEPFNHPKLRRAFSLALNRQDIVDHVLQGNQMPALSLLPPTLKENYQPLFADHDLATARQLLREVRCEIGHLPSITLMYMQNERNHTIAQAVQQQWREALDLDVRLQPLEGQLFTPKLKSLDYDIAYGSWFVDTPDAIDMLSVFESKRNGTNNTGWEDEVYAALLARSNVVQDPAERNRLLADAEKILIDQMPVAPLFFPVYNFVRQPALKGASLNELGHLDIRHATLD